MPSSHRSIAGGALRRLLALSSILVLAAVARATIGASLQMQLGNPGNATVDPSNHAHYLIQRDQYALDYDDATREPNWVSWDLTTDDIGSSGRSNFIQDTTLPAGFYQVLTTDYSGSGYDRGHMCPSADRTITAADNQQLFYMSNMVPQSPDNNQGIWANFESYCRSLASAGNEVLITCGPSGFGGSTIASGVAIPGYTWKIAVVVPLGPGSALSRITASTRVIAIKVPNIAGVRSTPWQNFVTSAAQIEADTGYTFFGALPTPVANALRIEVDGQSSAGTPAIVAQPANQTTVVGGSATFTVTATGDAPLSYQWYHDDDTIAGATDATLTLNNVQASDLGGYSVVVSNGVGSATSNAAQLIITGLPPSITTPPSSETVSAGSSITFTVAVSGSPTLTYQWRKNTAPIAGATSSTLTLTNVQAADAANYDVVVTNSVGSATSAVATLTVSASAPTIAVQPISKAANAGSNAGFSVSAFGTAPLTYQWRKSGVALTDGGAISGSTTASLLFTSVAPINAGDYDVVVTNPVSSVTSAVATLTVNPPPPSTVYWNFETATPTSGLDADLTGGTITQGNNNGTTPLLTTTSASSGYTGVSGGNNAGAAARTGALNQAAAGSAYFEFTLTPSAGKRVLASGISFGSRSTSTGPQAFRVYTNLDGYTTPVASGTFPNDSKWYLYTPSFSSVTGVTGTAVTFRVYAFNGTGTASAGTANWRIDDLKLTVTTVFPPPVPPVVTATSPADGATSVPVASPITVTFDEAVSFTGTWFTITSAANGPMAATVTGGPTTFTLTPPSYFANTDTVTVSILGAQVVDQATRTIHGSGNTSWMFTTEAYVPPTPATVTTQPTAQSVNVGDTATFTVGASGTAPFTYQWRKDGTAISGNSSATTSTLTLVNATTSDAGGYDCIVSNVAGSDVSHLATLTVSIVAPTITTPPVAQSPTVGGTATLTVAAAGTAPFSYQWRKDGTPIAGANTATLTLANTTYADSGAYDVVVTNTAGSATSTAAVVVVLEAAPSDIYWDFASADPTSGIPAGVTGGTFSQGNNNGTTALLTTTSASGSYTGASGGNNVGAAARTGALSVAANGSAYFEFTFSAAAGRQFAATELSFGMRSTGTGPQAFALYSSADNYAVPLASGAVTNNSVWHFYAPAFRGAVSPAGGAVTFRLYGFNGAGSPGANTANWRVDDVTLTGGVLALPPVPPNVLTPPISQTATVGDSVSFTVGAAGTAPFTYQWRKDGVQISGNASATTATLVLSAITSHDAAAYDCVVTNIAGSVTSDPATLTVNKAAATVALDALTATYDGTAHPVTATTTPSGLNVTFTYDGNATAPTNAGSYAVVATIEDADYAGSTTGTLVIAPATASISLGNLGAIYTGTGHAVSATTNPVGLNVVLTYDGNPTPPANAGSYAVAATIADPNYVGSATGTLVIAKAAASIGLGNLSVVYDGTPRAAGVTTTPAGLAVAVTYDGNATPPTNTGTYAVAATITDPNYVGSATGTLVIAKAVAPISLGHLSAVYDGSAHAVSVATTPAGLTVLVTYNGSSVVPTNAGTYSVAAAVADPNYTGFASGTLVIAKATATVVLDDLVQMYDGTPKAVVAATAPAGLNLTITYNGQTAQPTTPGLYTVVATIDDPNYSGSAQDTLLITTTALVRHAPTINGGVDGSVQVLLPESISLNGGAWISDDLLVPGTPTVRMNGQPIYAGTIDGTGATTPSNYTITLNGSALLRHVVRRTDAIAMPTIVTPPSPTGTRNVALNSPTDSVGDFTTVRNLTLNGNAGTRTIPAGTYGTFVVNGSSTLVLGVAGATTPAVYNLQGLTLNGSSQLQVVGPIVLNLASGVALNGSMGDSGHPEWLVLNVASGGLTLNGHVTLDGFVTAPAGTVTINGSSTLNGGVIADRLTINGSGTLNSVE